MHPPSSSHDTPPPRWLIATLWLVLAIVWFGTLGYRDLIHPDEGRYAEIAREMAVSGDWVTPRLNDLKYFEKPALQYWAGALAFKLFGESDFVARLWPGLTGFLAIVLAAYTARRLWGARAGWFSALACASSAWMISNAHLLTLDMGVSAWLTLVLCGFVLAQHDGASKREHRYWMWAVWAGMAGATLSKGLIGILIPGTVLVLYTLWQRDWHPWARMQWLAGLAIFFGLTAPWFIVVSQSNPEFAQFFFIHEHFQRFLTPVHRRSEPWHYFIPMLLLGLVPWTTLLPAICKTGLRKHPGRFQPQRLIWLWALFVLLFFSASDSKLPSYILPMFPALALLLGRTLNTAGRQALRWHALSQAAFWMLLGALALGFAGDIADDALDLTYIRLAAPAALAMAVMLAAASWLAGHGRMLSAALAMAAATLIPGQLILLNHQVYAPLKSTRQLVQQIQSHIPSGTPFFSVAHYEQTLPFYLKRPVTLVQYVDEFELGIRQEPHKAIPSIAAFAVRWRTLPQAAAITSPNRFTELETLKLPLRVIHRDSRRVVFVKQ